jgi:hypothetical protein
MRACGFEYDPSTGTWNAPSDQYAAYLLRVNEHLHVFVGAVKRFPPDALGYHAEIVRPAGFYRQTGDVVRAEGLDPDDPAVIASIDLVRWELSLGT